MRSSILIALLFVGYTVQGQNDGLYGKKWCVDFSTSGHLPLFNFTNGNVNKSRGGTLISKKDLFDYGFRTGASYALSNNFAFGIEFDFEFSNVDTPENIEIKYPSSYGSITIIHEALTTMSTVIMPTFTFTSSDGILPIGLSHQVGIGFLQTKVLKKDYDYKIFNVTNSFGELPITSDFEEEFYDYDLDSYKGVTLMYTLNVRTPINEFMMITYGIRYNANILLSPDIFIADNSYYPQTQAFRNIRRRTLRTLISFNLGMAFAL